MMNRKLALFSVLVPHQREHAIERLRAQRLVGRVDRDNSFLPVGLWRMAFWKKAARPQPGSPQDVTGKRQAKGPESTNLGSLVRAISLEPASWAVSRSVSIWVAVGLPPETESSKGELAPLRRASPVAYGTHRGPPRCRSIRICGGHSPELNQSQHQVFCYPPGAWRTSRGFRLGAQAQAHLPPLPAEETRSFREFSSAYKLQEQGQRHWGRGPLLSPCLITAAGLLFLAVSFKKKKKPQECWKWLHSL